METIITSKSIKKTDDEIVITTVSELHMSMEEYEIELKNMEITKSIISDTTIKDKGLIDVQKDIDLFKTLSIK